MFPATDSTSALLLLLGGSGSRFGSALPKQFLPLGEGGRPVFQQTLDRLLSVISFSDIVLVAPEPWLHSEILLAPLQSMQNRYSASRWHLATGGHSRHGSFLSGCRALQSAGFAGRQLAVHDANRPFLSDDFLLRVKENLALLSAQKPCLIPVMPAVDSLCLGSAGKIERYLPREQIFRVQTPQLLFAGVLDQLLARPPADYGDEGSFLLAHGFEVFHFAGDAGNLKITYREDLPT